MPEDNDAAAARPILPLISSGTVGPLGLCHLPRLWAKALLHETGHLPEGYRHGAGGIDELLFLAVGIDANAFAAFMAERPTYLECEAWVRSNASNLDSESIASFNDMLRNRTKPAVQLQSQWRFIGLRDESVRHTVLANDLDDWMSLHYQATTGTLPFIAASMHAAFSELLTVLVHDTGASRATVRVDLPQFGFEPRLPMAEALRPGSTSALDSVHAGTTNSETVQYMLRERRPLIQGNLAGDGPASHADFTDKYNVQARMIGPVFAGDRLAAWISVHDDHPREWSEDDVAALSRAMSEMSRLAQMAIRSQG